MLDEIELLEKNIFNKKKRNILIVKSLFLEWEFDCWAYQGIWLFVVSIIVEYAKYDYEWDLVSVCSCMRISKF